MKRYIITFLLICFAASGYGQPSSDYKVVRVVGTVENLASGKTVMTGDIIKSSNKLTFGSKDAYIIISSPETGRKKISGVPDNKSREIFLLLQSFVQPELRSTASRGVSLVYIETLTASMAFDKLLILSPAYIVINTQKLSLKAPAAIKAGYQRDKKMQYIKVSDQSGMHLDERSIFGDFTRTESSRVLIEYFEDEKLDPVFNPGILIASFVPIYPDEKSLETEVRALISSLPKTSTSAATYDEIRGYLAAEYANAQEDNLKQWLEQRGILSK